MIPSYPSGQHETQLMAMVHNEMHAINKRRDAFIDFPLKSFVAQYRNPFIEVTGMEKAQLENDKHLNNLKRISVIGNL